MIKSTALQVHQAFNPELFIHYNAVPFSQMTYYAFLKRMDTRNVKL